MLCSTLAWCTIDSATEISLPRVEKNIIIGIATISIWNVSIACIKTSVACLLLRVPHHLMWRMVLYVTIVLVVACSIGSFAFNLLQCRPLAAAWDYTVVDAKCVGPKSIQIASNVSSGVNIATDVILSLYPLTFLPKLRRPAIEKVLVSILMAMGLAASAASIWKSVLVRQWGVVEDWFPISFAISTWTCVEMFLGITAACSPSLKPLVQRFLTLFGVDFGHSGSFSFVQSMNQDPTSADSSPSHASARNQSEKSRSNNENSLRALGMSDSTKPPHGNGNGNGIGSSESGSEEFKTDLEGRHGPVNDIK